MDTHYELVIYWSADDQCFIAEVPELPGCMADGGSYQEVVANVQTVIAEWVETALLQKRSIPKPVGKLMYA